MEITYENFRKVDIRVGTVLSLRKNEKAHQPALILEVDFGNKIGIKTSSTKITHYYNSDNLVGEQIIAVCNFPTKILPVWNQRCWYWEQWKKMGRLY